MLAQPRKSNRPGVWFVWHVGHTRYPLRGGKKKRPGKTLLWDRASGEEKKKMAPCYRRNPYSRDTGWNHGKLHIDVQD